MPDIDVMKWLEICGKNGDCSRCCPYEGDVNCRDSLMVDALELLKEQQKKIEERTNEATAYAELLIKYGYEFN